MEFRVLGSLQVEADGRPVRVGPKQRVVLAALLVELGRVIPSFRLVELVRGQLAAEGAAATLRSHIYHLRRALEPGRPRGDGSELLVTGDGGYRLCVPPEQVDAVRFKRLLRNGQEALAAGDPATAAVALNGALALWRGPVALPDLAEQPFAHRYAEELGEVRRAAEEARIEAELAIGHHVELVGELRTLAAHTPSEVVWKQLALALYRGNRAGEAALVCRRGLEHLARQGLDAPALQDCQRAILQRDPALDFTPPAATAPRAIGVPGQRQAPPVPWQLLPRPADFTGRVAELARLDRTLDTAAGQANRAVVICGMAGVGKTALALHWLHGLRTRYPDGGLYADLRGCGAGRPLAPEEVLGQFLRALGATCVPGSPDEQAAQYRSLTAGRRMLVLLDNADSAAQVRPLLTGSDGCAVVVTSRWRLGGLLADGAELLRLDPLGEDDAVELLSRRVADGRLEAEPEPARELVGLCGRLPIAVCVAAARLVARPRSRIGRMVGELRGEQRRLGVLTVDDVSVRAAFDLSYRALPPAAARLYRVAGLLPGRDFSSTAAAAAAGLPVEEVEPLLDTLVDASMLEDISDDAYRLHDLLGLHAQQTATADGAPGEQETAVRGVLDWYLACAAAADRVVMPHRRRYPPPRTSACPPGLLPPLAGPGAALAWLESERGNLLAAVRVAVARGWHSTAWQLVDAMWSLFLYRKHYHDWVESHRIGIGAARACGHLGGEAMLLNHLGLAFHGLGQLDEARAAFDEALAVHRATGDRQGEASALNSLGLAQHGLDRVAGAVELFTRAAGIQQDLGDRRGEALTRANLGRAHDELGHTAEARRQLEHALSVFAALPDRYNEARTLHSLGSGAARAGDADAAARHLRRALAVMRELGARLEEARILETLGDHEQAAALYLGVRGPPTVRPRDRPGAPPAPVRPVSAG